MSALRESTRTLLYSTCIFGLWVPIVWLVGAVVVVRAMRPPSHYKRGMQVSFGLVLTMLAIFSVASIVAAFSVERWTMIGPILIRSPQWNLNLEIVSGVTLGLYAISGLLFVVFADATFRSTVGQVVNQLRSPLFLRGVHLCLNIAGMFMPMPLFSLVGIPVTLHQLRVMRQKRGARTIAAVWVCGVLSFVSLVAFCLFVIVAGSVVVPGRFGYDDVATARAKVEAGCFRNGSSADSFPEPQLPVMRPNSNETEPELATILIDNCPHIEVRYPVSWLSQDPVFIAVVFIAAVLVQNAWHIAFVVLGDRIILREIVAVSAKVVP